MKRLGKFGLRELITTSVLLYPGVVWLLLKLTSNIHAEAARAFTQWFPPASWLEKDHPFWWFFGLIMVAALIFNGVYAWDRLKRKKKKTLAWIFLLVNLLGVVLYLPWIL
ncbi:hypothetical protein [Luteibaculum oceani]|uniref:Uncharacterized protein n=1 Tax=Luteibaculum oceani TaxID=1294296 RepID=A0A5C6VKI5_9FLAO|nr:hypothetical protein [Luteibaculum oceani]TXC85174.1 hypothetical protein FRX97_00710 [Luteibaculum oceani]